MSESKSKFGVGLPGIVFVVFLTMKLAEVGVVAQWSWWWVTCPLWIPTVVVAVVFGSTLVVGALCWVVSSIVTWLGRSKRMDDH